ncbi:MAG: acetate/propionate family kinase [Pseudomonadota bacterium]
MSVSADAILVINAGSSSIKFALYPRTEKPGVAALMTGAIEGLAPGEAVNISIKNAQKNTSTKLQLQVSELSKFDDALAALRNLITQQSTGMKLVAVAHRIVHGGERYADSIIVDDDALAYLQTLIPLAPLHQAHNLAGLIGFAKAYPGVPQIACFDTGFHQDLPDLERTLPLNKSLRDQGMRRFGFHGLSYRFVAARMAEKSPRANQRMLMAHLGNGASLCATLSGKSHATSMGFSTLDGLMMGTRCGALDPGVLLYLLNQGWDSKKLETTLYQDSGLLGVSGISADMRSLRASTDEAAAFAIALFTHKLIRECGALIACIGGIDVLAFTGGIGEHDAVLRQQTCQALAYLGVQIDEALNKKAIGTEMMAIHAPSSLVGIWVVPTDEGSVALSDAMALI